MSTESQPQHSEHCPGPQQHGHPLVYESHCDHGETQPHEIKRSEESVNPQQEWTRESLRKFVTDMGWDVAVASINAALAAAWKEHDDVVDALANRGETIKQFGAANQKLNKQLTAERQRATHYRAGSLDNFDQWQVDRQRREQEERGGHRIRILNEPYHLEGLAVCDRCHGGEIELETPCAERLEQQLLSAQAAIEKHNHTRIAGTVLHVGPIEFDLSLLHQHDAMIWSELRDLLHLPSTDNDKLLVVTEIKELMEYLHKHDDEVRKPLVEALTFAHKVLMQPNADIDTAIGAITDVLAKVKETP